MGKIFFLSFPDFSLRVWKQSKYLDIYEPLPEYGLSLLFEELGVAQYLNQRQCSGDSMMYNNTALTNGLFIVVKKYMDFQDTTVMWYKIVFRVYGNFSYCSVLS